MKENQAIYCQLPAKSNSLLIPLIMFFNNVAN